MEKGRKVGAYLLDTHFPIQEQERKLQTWAGENGASIQDFYVDKMENISVPLGDRKEFKRLLGDIRSHRIDSILTVDYERLADDKGSLDRELDNLHSEGVNIYSISDVLRGQ